MSAFYLTVHDDAVQILTDGAVYTEDGTLLDIASKIRPIGDLPLAMTARGTLVPFDVLAPALDLVAGAGSVDGVMKYLETILAKPQRRRDLSTTAFQAVLVGISEQHGPFARMFASVDMPGIEAFLLYDVAPESAGGPEVSIEELPFTGADYEAAGVFALQRYGVAIMEAMRRKPGPNPAMPDLPELYGIGGHVDLTVVHAGGVTTARLHEWPDRIGEKINPFAADAAAIAAE